MKIVKVISTHFSYLSLSLMLLTFTIYASELPDFIKPLPIEPQLVRPPIPDGMALVKGGCFEMGDAFGDGNDNEKPPHEVCVDDFYIGKYEVTVGEFKEFVRETGYHTEAEMGGGCYYWNSEKWEWKKDKNKSWENPLFSQTDRNPVVCVSWNDANAYVNWKGLKSGLRYRLPTEAEWEYAARSGGKKHKYSWGNSAPSGNIADESAKSTFPKLIILRGYDDGYVYTSPVGSFKPNEVGLYDMTGNVWEWVQDLYGEGYYKNSPKDNPTGPSSGKLRIIRGGSWGYGPIAGRTTYRGGYLQAFGNDDFGFRLAISAR